METDRISEQNQDALLQLLKNDYLSKSLSVPDDNSFNIFRVLEIESKEVFSCRFIGKLLNYNREILETFMKQVLGIAAPLSAGAYVELEEPISHEEGDGRADIVIHDGNKVYPIEAKIGAGDQHKQLQRYYEYFTEEKKFDVGEIYYLTPSGRWPSDQSRGRLPQTIIKCISYNNEIQKWLKTVEKITEDPVKSFAQQYREIIGEMSNTTEMLDTLCTDIELYNSEMPMEENKLLAALINILLINGDTNGVIQTKIQQEYLRRHIKYNREKYDLIKPEEASEKFRKKPDTHAILYIVGKGNKDAIAWICVDTNLYIGCNKRKADGECEYNKGRFGKWHKNENWAYLRPEGYEKEAFELRSCINVTKYNQDIVIEDALLRDIIVE